MPKKPPRHNPQNRDGRTVQSAASLLQRISRKIGGAPPTAGAAPQAVRPGQTPLERLRKLLPPELQPHLVEVLEKSGELVLFADSAVWAGRLKLAAPQLAAIAAGRRQVVRVMPQHGPQR
jgi:hypothetical protein